MYKSLGFSLHDIQQLLQSEHPQKQALALLAQMGFGEATVRRARAMAEHFERTRAWETL